ncbi:hypothetical protein [Sphingosinicella sp. BN140058]|uniref:hypothetical protein n=1 Tax=Sphingosinicella sp. BN140058 TaxID=1892855 RepID=UPI001011CB11|nr:hypothetical protein [Sphingosinicella sp. BN140058]QAY79269.1 hypothetical protein ETR14_24055 [Sphingosinicella sp. BN140058]
MAEKAKSTKTRSGKQTGAASPDRDAGESRNKKIVTGAAIGIGSAAIVAALLYANRRGKTDRNEG